MSGDNTTLKMTLWWEAVSGEWGGERYARVYMTIEQKSAYKLVAGDDRVLVVSKVPNF